MRGSSAAAASPSGPCNRFSPLGRSGRLATSLAQIRTHARKVDGGYVVNCAKTFITGGVRGEGVTSSPLKKLGWDASDTAKIALQDVFVPEENLLGSEHGGFYLIMANFQWERLLMALGAVGAMQVCFERTLRFVLEQGGPKQQAIRHKVAKIAVEIEAGRDVTYAALRRYAAGEEAVREVTIAKLRAQRAAFDAIDACLQIHGLDATPELEPAARDSRLGPIGGGTDEILGRSLGL